MICQRQNSVYFNPQKDVVTQFWSLLNEVIVPYTPVSSPETSQNHSLLAVARKNPA